MQPRARVIYLSHAFMVGGAEEMVLSLVRRLPARYEPMVVCIHDAGPIGEEIRRTGVRFEVLGLNPGLARPLDVLKLRDFLIAANPTIVHTFLLTGSLYGRFAAMMADVPVVIGTVLGLALAVLAGAGLSAFLTDVTLWAPDSVAVVAAVIAAVAVLAALGPARRAGRTDPTLMLR